MNPRACFSFLRVLLPVALGVIPGAASACTACYGASDSPLAQGMNWGIMVLLGFIGTVLGCITTFFVYIGRRSAALAAAQKAGIQTDTLP